MVFSLIGFLVVGVLAVKLYQDRKRVTRTLESEKKELISNLESLQKDYEDIGLLKDEISDELQVAQLDLLKYIDSLKNMKIDYSILSRVRRQLGILKKEREILLNQNDSLRYSLQALGMERDSTITQLRLQMELNDSLTSQATDLQKKLEENSGLNINKVSVVGARERSNGKLSTTRKASKADLLKICFTVEKNPLASNGDFNFYITVVDPTGIILGADKTISNRMGRSVEYSIISNFYYDNASSLDVCDYINQEKGKRLSNGEYSIRIYDQNLRKVSDYRTVLK
ncbi:hypothetical protein ElyMa_002164900 [Elysia marginata]|uniref:Uncharacterized protein n=1 Tax=Elysia marginata TaxID=1093978 RepID=A0AAV4FP89_9GAST|nr:hypothetical protein ElyMa_002164900 [Elysia marginata]